ncbi:hypothetical protein T06_12384 [Trichinella sp. T6]|nr:hypothetical protein T06_12384 [Trichinella sp. T6]
MNRKKTADSNERGPVGCHVIHDSCKRANQKLTLLSYSLFHSTSMLNTCNYGAEPCTEASGQRCEFQQRKMTS